MFKFILLAAACIACVSADGNDVHAEVRTQTSHVRVDGFETLLDTSNGIHQQASGDVHGNIHGAIDWVSPEGVKVDIEYVADEHGYQPKGDLIPTPHPIPEAIVKALAYIEAHPPKEENHK